MATEQPKKIGPYEVASLIGEGAMGTVYKATDPKSGNVVAIKVLKPDFVEDEEAVERFHREAEAVARLRHANLVRIIQKEQLDDVLYFVMEYVPGTALETVLRRRRLSLREAFVVFKKVCAGLQAAHHEKIVHRDLSPRNILVSEDLETVKIVDFGISRVESISNEMGTLSTTQVSLGSLHYMAPEQAVDMRQTDHRADIYSLGVLFYEMLTGRVPVGRYSLPSAINSEVPSDVDPIILRCLETKPGDRFSSVSRLLARVDRLDDQLRLGLVSEIRDLQRSTSKIFVKPRQQAKWVLTAVALLIAAAATFYLLSNRSAPAEPAAPADPGSAEIAQTAVPEGKRIVVVPATRGAGEAIAIEGEGLDLDAVTPPPVDAEPVAGSPADTPARPVATTQRSAPPASTAAKEDLEVARAKVEAGLYEPALRDLEALIAAGGRETTIAAAMLLLGEVHAKMGDSAEAKAAWIELGQRFGRSAAAAEGSYRRARLEHSERGRSEPREVWKAYNVTIESYPRTPWVARALMDRAELEKAEKWRVDDAELGVKVPMALVTYRQMTAGFPNDASAEKAFFELAEMYEDLRRFDLAASTFESLAKRFPDNLREAWWRAAQLYDSRRLNDPEKAIAAYEKVPESSRHHADAQRRLARLKR